MNRRIFIPVARLWLFVLVCGTMILLPTGGQSASTCAIQFLLGDASSSESENSKEEDMEEASKPATTIQSARKAQRRNNRQSGPLHSNIIPLQTESLFRSLSLRRIAASCVGELAHRNGLGAPLRC